MDGHYFKQNIDIAMVKNAIIELKTKRLLTYNGIDVPMVMVTFAREPDMSNLKSLINDLDAQVAKVATLKKRNTEYENELYLNENMDQDQQWIVSDGKNSSKSSSNMGETKAANRIVQEDKKETEALLTTLLNDNRIDQPLLNDNETKSHLISQDGTMFTLPSSYDPPSSLMAVTPTTEDTCVGDSVLRTCKGCGSTEGLGLRLGNGSDKLYCGKCGIKN
tara:strand:- start:22 stop:681 length:660 start_codon:yes stop_codon:yes gene_type:complete